MRKYSQVTDQMLTDIDTLVADAITNPTGPIANREPRLPLLETRQHTHGKFEANAALSQAIKRILRASPGWQHLHDVEREAMDMIALKFSRLLSGRPLELQHWEDITGYAKLAEEQCKP